MIIGITKETALHETRIGLTPQTTKQFIDLGFKIKIEQNAGLKSCFRNSEYTSAGAEIVPTAQEVLKDCDILFKVNTPEIREIKLLKNKSFIIGNLRNNHFKNISTYLKNHNITCFDLNMDY